MKRNQSRKALERRGFSFVWGYSAFTVCVRFNGEWIGTFTTDRAYGIPHHEINKYLTNQEEQQ